MPMNTTTKEIETKEIKVEVVDEPFTEQERMTALLMLLDQLLEQGVKFKPSIEFQYRDERERLVIEKAFSDFRKFVEERKPEPKEQVTHGPKEAV
jgi:hypothetical protein